MQRLRVKFSRGSELKFISHLDIIRLWQRAFNRAGIEIAYSEGFSPHPRIALAAPLALGVTGEAELMDIVCAGQVSPQHFTEAVEKQLPRGMSISQALVVGLNLPSLQSLVRFAEYRVEVENEKSREDIETAISSLLGKKELPWQHMRDTGPRKYDLRALIDKVWLIDSNAGQAALGMKLRCDSSGSGRPEQVTLALGFEEHPLTVHRTKLILAAA